VFVEIFDIREFDFGRNWATFNLINPILSQYGPVDTWEFICMNKLLSTKNFVKIINANLMFTENEQYRFKKDDGSFVRIDDQQRLCIFIAKAVLNKGKRDWHAFTALRYFDAKSLSDILREVTPFKLNGYLPVNFYNTIFVAYRNSLALQFQKKLQEKPYKKPAEDGEEQETNPMEYYEFVFAWIKDNWHQFAAFVGVGGFHDPNRFELLLEKPYVPDVEEHMHERLIAILEERIDFLTKSSKRVRLRNMKEGPEKSALENLIKMEEAEELREVQEQIDGVFDSLVILGDVLRMDTNHAFFGNIYIPYGSRLLVPFEIDEEEEEEEDL